VSGHGPPESRPQTFTAPAAPHGDPAALRQAAAAFRQLADEVRTSQRQVAGAFSQLSSTWKGEGQQATAHPVAVLATDTERAAGAMDEIAALLERHAAELHRAQSAHSFSWGKLLKIGAIVVVSAGLVVVTVGAAAPEVAAADSLLVGGEVGAMEAAAGAASTAASGVGSGLLAAARAFSTLRGLVAFSRPALPWAIGFTGLDAVEQEVSSDRLDVGRLATEFGISLLASPVLTRTSAALRAGALAERPVAIAATTHAAAAGMGGGSEAVREQLEHGKVSLSSVEVAAGEAGGLSVGGEALKHFSPRVWRAGGGFYPLPKGAATEPPERLPGWQGDRQTAVDALKEPFDARQHEGKNYGHAIKKHGGQVYAYQQGRIKRGGLKAVSTFNSLETLNASVERTLRSNRDIVLRTAAGPVGQQVPIYAEARGDEGWILTRLGRHPRPKQITVVLRKKNDGYTYVHTAYLE